MRLDVLDEYSTLVPFGLGVSQQNRVVQYPATATNAVKPGAIAVCVGSEPVTNSCRNPVRRSIFAIRLFLAKAMEIIAYERSKRSAMSPAASAPIACPRSH
jgi:hypothetical protein